MFFETRSLNTLRLIAALLLRPHLLLRHNHKPRRSHYRHSYAVSALEPAIDTADHDVTSRLPSQGLRR